MPFTLPSLPPRGLRRDLTWRYTLVTVAALLVVELIGLALLQNATAGATYIAQPGAKALDGMRAAIRAHLAAGARAPEALQRWLDGLSLPVFGLTDATGRPQITLYTFPRPGTQSILIVDRAARLLAATPGEGMPRPGERLELPNAFPALPRDLLDQLARLPAEAHIPSLLNAAPESRYTHVGNPTVFHYPDPGHQRLVLVTPVVDAQQHFAAALLIVTHLSDAAPVSAGLFAVLLASLLAFTVAAGLVGMVFGALTAGSLVRRLDALVATTAAWGHGDFGRRVADASPDEIGRLAAHLNRLGAQLESLLAARQQLAAAEERNRLARDLHDSIKQQVFAISMNLGTVGLRWDADPAAARARLDDAADLARRTQRELTALIHTLRPAPLDDRPLGEALRELAGAWQAQTGIATACSIAEGSDGLPPPVDDALYRVTQEALANIARHSGATRAEVVVERVAGAVRLDIRDDGHGFDPAAAAAGIGLRSMCERVEALGGRWTVASGAAGTRLTAEIPLETAATP